MDGTMYSKKINRAAVFTAAVMIFISAPAFALTVGVADFKTADSGIDSGKVSDFFQMEIQKKKSATVRDRKAISAVLEQMKNCETGLTKCDDKSMGQTRMLDIVVFGELNKNAGGYLLNVRAVSEKSWSVIFSQSLTGSNYETLLEDIAAELNDKLKTVDLAAEGVSKSGGSGLKHRIAINQIRYANEAAQKVSIGDVLDSVLITAFGKNSKFEIVERARVADLLNEKTLAMSDLVQTDRVEFEARGITHILNGTMKVYDDVRALSYQIVNVKTGLPIASDIIEWTDEKELKGAMTAVAQQCEEQIFQINGKLAIEKCDMDDVRVFMEKKEAGSTAEELGFCPLTVEDIPKGRYTLLFKHEERDTLSMDIEIKAQETFRIPLVKMPPIDMTAFNDACSFEISGKHDAAIEKYREFYRKHTKHRLSHYAMYREGFIVQIYQRKYVDGRRILEEVIKRNPDAGTRTEAYYGIALGYQVEGQMDKSREILKMLLNEYPASTAAEQAKECLDKGKCSL